MTHDITLISTIAASLVLAFIFGFVAQRLRLPPLIGYLVAGVVVGPMVSGDIADGSLASQLAEIGIMLMMFGVGLHFSVADLMAVRRLAIPGAVGQIIIATATTAALTLAWGWSLGAGLVFGLSLSVASTVVLLRALESRNAITTTNGRISVGWLIVEDLAMVLTLVLLPALVGVLGGVPNPDAHAVSEQSLLANLGITLAKVSGFIAIALLVGPVVLPWLLKEVARTGSRELFTLAVLAMAIGIAFAAANLVGVSFALGAFFAGMVLNKSELSHKAAANSLPLQDAFGVLFFVSVGMLFDPSVLLREPLAVLGVILVIVIGKSVAAFLIVLAFRYPVGTALTVSASLAQIGEFSFILMGLGIALQLLPAESRDLILAGALCSIAINPFVFAGVPAMERWIRARPRLVRLLEREGARAPEAGLPPSPQRGGHAVVVGHGRVGSSITQVLQHERLPFVVVERDRPRFDALRARGVPAVFGDATVPEILDAAGIGSARLLIVATPDSYRARRVLELAEAANRGIQAVVRTHSEDELARLRTTVSGHVVMGERELARTMLLYVLREFGVPPERARRLAEEPSSADLDADAERR